MAREEIADDFLPAFLAYYDRGDDYGFWAAVERISGRFLGWFHYRPEPGAGPLEPELGYRLHTTAWGRGFATEVSQALIDDGFANHGVEQVNASTMVVNVASRRVMEKVGMRLVRTFHADWPVRIDGDEHGDVEYAITERRVAGQPLGSPAEAQPSFGGRCMSVVVPGRRRDRSSWPDRRSRCSPASAPTWSGSSRLAATRRAGAVTASSGGRTTAASRASSAPPTTTCSTWCATPTC